MFLWSGSLGSAFAWWSVPHGTELTLLELPGSLSSVPPEVGPGPSDLLPFRFLQKCEKLVLSLCCNSLSLPFHEPVSPLVRKAACFPRLPRSWARGGSQGYPGRAQSMATGCWVPSCPG